jgi:Ca2+-binding RTX toxin-like protein
MANLMKPLGTEFTVNATTAGMQWFHSVGALSSGEFVAVWIDSSRTGGDASGYSIKGQRVSSSGAFAGGEFLVNQVTDGDQLEPFVTGLAGGGFVVTWLGNSFQTTIKGRVFDAAGNGGAEFLVDTNNGVYGLGKPHAFALATGGFVLSWTEAGDVKAQIFAADGTTVGGEFTVNAGLAGGQGNPDGVALANGSFLITWTDGSVDVEGRIFDASGNPLTSDFHLAGDPAGADNTTEVTALVGGGFAVSWQGYDDVTKHHQAHVQIFDAFGNRVGGEIVASEPDTYASNEMSIASFGWGGFVVAWSGLAGPFQQQKIVRAQLFDGEGNRIGDVFDLNTQPVDHNTHVEITVTAEDRLVATWQNGAFDVQARIFSSPIAGTAAGETLQGTSGADALVGLGGDDSIHGLGGDDVIQGGPGADTLYGGADNDTYVAEGSETIVEAAGEGTDTVETALAVYSLETIANIERLAGTARTGQSLTGNGLSNEIVGSIGADSLFGLAGNDALRGGAGNDLLDGGAGADAMHGGLGDDVYVVDDAGDTIVETDYGRDRVETSLASYALGDHLEDLTGTSGLGQSLTGNAGVNEIVGAAGDDVISGGEWSDTLRGNGGHDVLRGDEGDDFLFGGAGNDELDGGTGFDEMDGGSGDDVYIFDHEWDTAIEAADGGTDEVRSAAAFVTIEFSPNVEKLTGLALTGQTLLGNAGANVITGNAGHDGLAGLAGDDVLIGGAGNDALRGGGGVDSYEGGSEDRTAAGTGAFGDRVSFNDLRATQGAAADLRTGTVSNDGFGNAETMTGIESLGGDTAFADTFHGNDSSNGFITGGGGDKVYGHGGNDRFEMGTAAAIVDGGEGTDLLFLRSTGGFLRPDANGDGSAEIAGAMPGSWTVDLAAGTLSDGYGAGGTIANVENVSGSAAADTLTGDGAANVLDGAAGHDRITGAGGADTLTGGAGSDRFVYAAVADSTAASRDRIADFQSGVDLLDVSALAPTQVVLSQAMDGATPYTLVTVTAAAGTMEIRVEGSIAAGDIVTEPGAIPGPRPIVGTAGDDVLEGTPEADTIQGLGGNDILYGRVSADLLEGGDGNDRLDGGDGADTMRGGAGDDVYVVAQAGDIVEENADQGIDEIETALGSFSLAALVNVENLTATGFYEKTLVGNALANRIRSDWGSDLIDGGAGADHMAGGEDNDVYIVDDLGDIVVEAQYSGFDEIRTALAAYSLAGITNIEKLTGTSASGQELTGNAESNYIYGGAGNDVIRGGGGGYDQFHGGAGDDLYFVDSHDARVVESAGGGTDEIRTGLTAYTLSDHIEKLTGTSATGQMLNGNNLANVLTGGAGNDLLRGNGGADTMQGGAGNDTYFVTDLDDIVLEAAGQGLYDEVQTGLASYTLAANVEILNGTSNSGQSLKGNALNNDIMAGNGNDILDGGEGADSMGGRIGSDIYYVDNEGDYVAEVPNDPNGIDEVRTTLAAYALTDHVEKLTGLLGTGQALTGNGLANVIVAGSGNDAIDGGAGNDSINAGAGDDRIDGGTGADAMGGFAGNDVFIVDNAGDQAIEAANEGTDEIRTGLASYSLETLIHIENLTGTSDAGQTLTGNGGNNLIVGGMGDDTIYGLGGDDVIVGFGGFDVMRGGAGDDVYAIDAGDTVIELDGEGVDEIRTVGAIYVLGVGLENLRATSDVGHDFRGNLAPNAIIGGDGNDIIRLQDGGGDVAFGKNGNDSFYFGGAFDEYDFVDGGDNRDSLILQGMYNMTLVYAPTGRSSIANIEGISLVSGTSTQYGQAGTSLYSYNLTLVDDNAAAGALMKVNGFTLQAGENLTLNASAETDAPLQVFAGFGTETLTGGGQGDAFVFGHDGRFGAGDTVNGGGGYDIVYLRGDYTVDFNAAGFQNALTNVESIALLTSANTEFVSGGDGEFDYSITWADALLASGATFTVNGSRLQAHESFTFDGSQETNGVLRVFGGAAADTLTGGGGADQLTGGGGADVLTGGAGADLFRYAAATDSTAGATDTIHGFVAGTDKIDVNRVDAKASTADTNEAFAFIGSNAFSAAGPNAPGELRAFNVAGNLWQVEGDVNGDGTADLVIHVHVDAGQPLTATDFVL